MLTTIKTLRLTKKCEPVFSNFFVFVSISNLINPQRKVKQIYCSFFFVHFNNYTIWNYFKYNNKTYCWQKKRLRSFFVCVSFVFTIGNRAGAEPQQQHMIVIFFLVHHEKKTFITNRKLIKINQSRTQRKKKSKFFWHD